MYIQNVHTKCTYKKNHVIISLVYLLTITCTITLKTFQFKDIAISLITFRKTLPKISKNISTICNMSGRIVSDIKTRAEGEKVYVRYNTGANIVKYL